VVGDWTCNGTNGATPYGYGSFDVHIDCQDSAGNILPGPGRWANQVVDWVTEEYFDSCVHEYNRVHDDWVRNSQNGVIQAYENAANIGIWGGPCVKARNDDTPATDSNYASVCKAYLAGSHVW